MIGGETQIKRIEDILQEISFTLHNDYGHILQQSDCGSTRVRIGTVKNGYDSNRTYSLSFDIIFGDFFVAGNEALLHDYDFIAIDDDATDKIKAKLKEIVDYEEKCYNEYITTRDKLLDYMNEIM